MLVNVERIQPQRDPVLGRVIVGERVFPGEKAPRGGLQVGLRLRRHTAREANALGRGNREGAHRAICLRAGEVDRPVGHLGPGQAS